MKAIDRSLAGRERGGVVVVVGPDGAGKSTLAEAVVRGAPEDTQTLLLANRRGATPARLLPRRHVRGPTTSPHRHPPYAAPVSIAKTVYLFADFLLTWFSRVRPVVACGGWVVIERGWWDTLVDPTRYRLRPAPVLTRALSRLAPRADVILILEAAPGVIRSRKAQLTESEIVRQARAWRSVLSARQHRTFIDASRSAEEVFRAAAQELSWLPPGESLDPVSTVPRAGASRASPRTNGEGSGEASRWFPLIRALMRAAPSLVVWKNASRTLRGQGDLDVVAAPADWPVIVDVFARWADGQGFTPALCDHVPNSLFLRAEGNDPPAFELDVKSRGTFRGSVLFEAPDLDSLVEWDDLGFRRLRPGAEGLLKLLLNGVSRWGTPKWERVAREDISLLVAADPEGAAAAASLFGWAAWAARDVAGAVATGGWSRSSMLVLEAWAARNALRHPTILTRRIGSRPTGSCPGLKRSLKLSGGSAAASAGRQLLDSHRLGA
jgi:thymidylate kinase